MNGSPFFFPSLQLLHCNFQRIYLLLPQIQLICGGKKSKRENITELEGREKNKSNQNLNYLFILNVMAGPMITLNSNMPKKKKKKKEMNSFFERILHKKTDYFLLLRITHISCESNSTCHQVD